MEEFKRYVKELFAVAVFGLLIGTVVLAVIVYVNSVGGA